MAIDTRERRASALNSASVGRRTLPLPDGAISGSDRSWLLRLYGRSLALPVLCGRLGLLVPVSSNTLLQVISTTLARLGIGNVARVDLDIPLFGMSVLDVSVTPETTVQVLPTSSTLLEISSVFVSDLVVIDPGVSDLEVEECEPGEV